MFTERSVLFASASSSSRQQVNTTTDQNEVSSSENVHMSVDDVVSPNQPPTATSLYAVPNMVRNSKRVAQYYDSDQLVQYADALSKSRKISKPLSCPSVVGNSARVSKKRKASNSLGPPKTHKHRSNYDWRGENQLPRALASVSGNLAAKFPSLIKGRPPD